MKNVYEDPAYAKMRKDLHGKLEELRKKYKDNSQLSQQYIDRFLDDTSNGKVFGVSKEEARQLLERRKKIK